MPKTNGPCNVFIQFPPLPKCTVNNLLNSAIPLKNKQKTKSIFYSLAWFLLHCFENSTELEQVNCANI